MAEYERLERKLDALLRAFERVFTDEENREAREYLEVGEYGLCLETLCAIVVERRYAVVRQARDDIREIHELMGANSEIVSSFLTTAHSDA